MSNKATIIRAGKLRHRAQVQSYTETQNAMGDSVKVWTTVAERWCSIKPLVGKEPNFAQQASPRISHEIVMRYFPNLDPTYRILWGRRVFKLHSTLDLLEIGKRQLIMAEELSQLVDQYVYMVDDDTGDFMVDDDTGAFCVGDAA